MLDNPKIRLSADKSPSTINDDVICSALGLSFFHPKYSYRIGNAVLGYVYVTTYIATKPTKGLLCQNCGIFTCGSRSINCRIFLIFRHFARKGHISPPKDLKLGMELISVIWDTRNHMVG